MKHQPDIERDAENKPSGQTPGENDGGTASSDRNSGLELYLRYGSIVAAAVTIVIALVELLSYAFDVRLFGDIHSGYIPMAPSTAVLFHRACGRLARHAFVAFLERWVSPLLVSLAVLVSLFRPA